MVHAYLPNFHEYKSRNPNKISMATIAQAYPTIVPLPWTHSHFHNILLEQNNIKLPNHLINQSIAYSTNNQAPTQVLWDR
jgi:hypothetical protein